MRRAHKLYVVSRYYISHEHLHTLTIADNMAGIGAFLKNAWNKEPIIVVSCVIGLTGFVLPFISPFTKYTAMLNAATPYNYPVPMRDDGSMPDVPSHPCETRGNRLEWLRKL
uniref:NADH dehydrogenase [ubiquinone] 1 alpha subcomplex subunit 3 n=1 Tax=Monopterus albus TaxID=43700 RepID=A0A3Q3QHS5_MONAL|nr:NADH dehydrogenase [ubiquinone] 1 alpha subcomplex subunit 3 [Monopterus albus]